MLALMHSFWGHFLFLYSLMHSHLKIAKKKKTEKKGTVCLSLPLLLCSGLPETLSNIIDSACSPCAFR